jgi:GT2 family glycosyltransferase
MMNVCVIVLNWNGQDHLRDLLQSLRLAKIKYEDDSHGLCRLVVLDNPGPTDDVSWIRANFPDIETVQAPCNDFLFSYNWLAPQLGEPYLVLLNNDLRVDPDFLKPLLDPFISNDNVLATSARALSWDGQEENGGAFYLAGKAGWFWPQMYSVDTVVPTLFAVGGYMAIDRQKFLCLGGFDTLFYPAYGEDYDLCLRGWEKGWKSLYVPTSIVYHKEGASWKIGDRRERFFSLAGLLILDRYFSSPGYRLGRTLHLLRQTLKPNMALPVVRTWLAARRRWSGYHGRRRVPFCFPSAQMKTGIPAQPTFHENLLSSSPTRND